MISLQRIHYSAIITRDYAHSKHFYCQVLGFTLIHEHYRAERAFWKGDLALQGEYLIELFSFPGVPGWLSRQEAQVLRYLAFSAADIEGPIASLEVAGLAYKWVRVDAFTGKKFTFFYRSRSVTAGAV